LDTSSLAITKVNSYKFIHSFSLVGFEKLVYDFKEKFKVNNLKKKLKKNICLNILFKGIPNN